MDNSIIFLFIKSPCGRAKYLKLASNKGFFSKARLSWFILIAALRDWHIQNES